MATAAFALGAQTANIYGQQTASNSSVTYTDVWPVWSNQYVTSNVTTVITSNQIWQYWLGATGTQTANQSQNITYQTVPVQLTAEQTAKVERQQREYNERMARQRVEKEAAETKATILLRSMLATDQRAQYEKERAFEVLTCRSGKTRRYKLTHGWAGNVFLLDESGRAIEKYCIHPVENIPVADNLVAQKLLLEADEESFLRIANKTTLPRAA